MSRLTTTGLVAAGALLAAGLTASLPATASAPAATFSPPLLLGGGGAEPSIRVPADGQSAAYVSAPNSLGSNFWRITEKVNPDKTISFVQSPVQQPDLGTGGGDSEISVGQPASPGACGTIAFSGLHNVDAFGNFTTAQSTDCGKTFSLANLESTQNTLSDRQWQAFDGKKTNFLLYHKVDTSQIVLSQSSDGGLTYVSLAPDSTRGVIDAATLPSVVNSNQVGNLVVDYGHPTGTSNVLSGEPTHRMYATFGGPRDPADNLAAQQATVPGAASYNHVDTVYLGVSDDGGLTWTDHKVFGVDPASKRELNMLFPVVDVDKAGNVYVVWSDTFRVEYAVSTDGGQTFGPAHQLNHDKLDGTRANLFPWLAAGANGLLDVVWYHGEGGSTKAYRDPGTAKTEWTVAFAQLGKANTAAPEELSYSEAVTPAIHKGDICLNGTFCDVLGGDRSLLDFFEVAIDANGRANVAMADNAGAPGAFRTAYSRQLSGVSLLTGEPLPVQKVADATLACPSDAAFTDPSGDATEVVVGTPLPSQPALDITRGSVSWDPAAKQLVLHTKLLDLSQDPPLAATGEVAEFTFAYAGTAYTAVGTHDSTGDEFHMEAPLRTQVGGALTGKFDKAASEVTMNVPADFFTKLGKGPVLAKGAEISGLAITTRRNDGVIVPNADEAGSLGCPFVIGADAVHAPTTVPAQVDHRPPPVLAATGLPLGLPLIGAGLLLGMAVLVRRRA